MYVQGLGEHRAVAVLQGEKVQGVVRFQQVRGGHSSTIMLWILLMMMLRLRLRMVTNQWASLGVIVTED